MPKPVCVPCQRFFRPKKNGYRLVEGMPVVSGAEPGTAEPEKWAPYKLWVADLWECHGCGAQIVSGFANQPIAEHYQPGFADAVAFSGGPDVLQVNDC